MSDRGMKKWAPYKSLVEHDPALVEMRKNRTKIEKPRISSEEAEIINELLLHHEGRTLIATIYKNGELIDKEIIIKTVDPYEKKIITTSRSSIYLKDLIGLRIKEE